MFLWSVVLIVLYSSNAKSITNKNYYETCKEEVLYAQNTLMKMIKERSIIENTNRNERIREFLENTKPFEDLAVTTVMPPVDCPYKPNTTIFPPPAQSEYGENKKETFENFVIPNFLNLPSDEDPFVTYLKMIYSSIKDIEEICNGPDFVGLDKVTDKQVLGLLGISSINHANHVCPICQKFLNHFRSIIEPTLLTVDKSNLHIIQYIFKYIPENEDLCSILLPGCHNEFKDNLAVGTRATKCMECSLCMTGTTVLDHTIFFNQQAVDSIHSFLNASIFHNICAELCNMGTTDLFPNGVSYNLCRNSISEFYLFIINAARNILIPNNFCSLELDVCKPGETPNILGCIQDLCLDGLPKAFKDICQIIPADPTEAAYFIGLKSKPEDEEKNRKMVKDMYKMEL
uniref:Saposin B-type domain-containing protein n=1 Tax=Parastrongyloides trichosuri TaxID=131310 RepID=A0A0N4ZU36_PARTI